VNVSVRRLALVAAVACLPIVAIAPSAHATGRGRAAHLGAPQALRPAASVMTPATADPLADPTSNTDPSSAFVHACASMDTSKTANDTCDAAATSDFQNAWTAEGISQTFALPGGFDTLSVPDQLLAISNLERTARGLVPITGLSTALNGLAQAGADADDDPAFPNPYEPVDPSDGSRGYPAGSNWAGAGNSALLDDFYWMYDDGVGSGNIDCSQPSDPGCWGHRHNIIATYAAPVMMGAAVTYGTTWGTSMATEFISADTADVPRFEVNRQSIALNAEPLASTTAKVTASAPTSMPISATISSGAGSWSVSPKVCDVTATVPCVFTVRFDAPSPGRHNGVLTLRSPDDPQTVALAGYQVPPKITIHPAKIKVTQGGRDTITGTVTSIATHHRVQGERVLLETRPGKHGAWHRRVVKRTNSRGVAAFTVRPTHPITAYRVLVLSATGAVEAVSPPANVHVG
jgi:hypothetical protein